MDGAAVGGRGRRARGAEGVHGHVSNERALLSRLAGWARRLGEFVTCALRVGRALCGLVPVCLSGQRRTGPFWPALRSALVCLPPADGVLVLLRPWTRCTAHRFTLTGAFCSTLLTPRLPQRRYPPRVRWPRLSLLGVLDCRSSALPDAPACLEFPDSSVRCVSSRLRQRGVPGQPSSCRVVSPADILVPPTVHFPSMDDDADGSPTPSEDGNLWTDAALDGVAGLDWVPAV